LQQRRLCELVHEEESQWELRLKALIAEEEKKKWKRIADALGKSEVGCKTQAKQMGPSK
jgi:hypothetical protein